MNDPVKIHSVPTVDHETKSAREVRLEEAMREVMERAEYALDEEKVSVLNFEGKSIWMGIVIGWLSLIGLAWIEFETSFFRDVVFGPPASWLFK